MLNRIQREVILMSKDLTVLAENRDVLLTAEIACWLHMIGKYTKEFIEGDHTKSRQLPRGLSQNLLKLLKEDLLQKNITELPVKDLQIPLIIEEFISKHELGNRVIKEDSNAFNKLLNDSHGRGSGTEKGVLNNDAYSNQNSSSIHISTAFGYEANPTDADFIDQNSKDLYTLIENILTNMLQTLEISKVDNLQRSNELRTQLITALKQHFTNAIGDTRRPINDVTLWDQTISSVAFFKAELAESLINGYKDPFGKKKYTFRYLQVTLDGESYIAKGTGIGDIISRRNLIDEAFDRAKSLIEVEYPLGLEIYRDTNGITFLIPELSEILAIDDLVVKDGVCLKQTISDEIVTLTNWEVTPFFHVSEKPSRNLYNLGSMVSKRPDGNIPCLKLQELWAEKAELCPSCNIRPIDINSIKRGQNKFCEQCSNRITGRGKQWAENRNNQTVWIDEIADSCGRISLLSFGLPIVDWLGTNNLSTFSIHSCRTLQFENMVGQFGDDPQHMKTNLNDKRFSEYLKIGNAFKRENLSVAGLFDLVCEEENMKLNDAENLVLSIWRKPPSFARVRRVWETTSKFWDEALVEIKEVINPITERLVLKAQPNNLNLPPNNSYEAKVRETKFTVFYENKNLKDADGFAKLVIIENLELLAKKLGVEIKKGSRKDLVNALIEKLKDRNIDFSNSNDPSKVLASSKINGIEIESCNYFPVIEIAKDPERFMVLVPADKALESAKKIKEKYEKEMGKVRNRLPMNLGIVYAGYHTALHAIMDAGRRLMRISNKENKWKLAKQPALKTNSDKFVLSFENGQTWKIPSKMGDCSEDLWYPYFYVVNPEAKPEERPLSFKGPCGNWLVHVSELKKDDKVQVTPSYFDFEFLSSASQRFEISYNSEGNRRSKDRKHRPYYLDDLDEIERVWVILSMKLSSSQIKKLNTLVEEKRRNWSISLGEKDKTFKSYIENVIDNIRWNQSLTKYERDTLVDFCVNRRLVDVLEIHMSILKDKSEVAE
ncbi:MAG: CRISPR-associated protein Csx11 [Kosmotoga sp.]|nr:MAG: CRISPR-associated protein Csx11 [Kosmotoga sp.]